MELIPMPKKKQNLKVLNHCILSILQNHGTSPNPEPNHQFVGSMFKMFANVLILLMEETLHQLIGSLHRCLKGPIHPRWCRVSSINSRMSCWNFRSIVNNYRNPFHFTSG